MVLKMHPSKIYGDERAFHKVKTRSIGSLENYCIAQNDLKISRIYHY